MLKRVLSILLLVMTLATSGLLSGCATTPASGLVPFADSKDGYRFLYPNGWIPAKPKADIDVLFHDIIEPAENVSMVISPLSSVSKISELGDATAIGNRLQQRVIAPEGSGRSATLLRAEQKEIKDKSYYQFEYAVTRQNGAPRHEVVSVAEKRGNLYTLSASTSEARWPKVKDLLQRVISSLTLD